MSSTDQFIVPWLLRFSCSGEVASSGKELTFLHFSICSSFLAFLSSTWTSIWRRLISVLSFRLFLNLLRWAAGELAFSLVDMVMRWREIAAQPAQSFFSPKYTFSINFFIEWLFWRGFDCEENVCWEIIKYLRPGKHAHYEYEEVSSQDMNMSSFKWPN